MSPLAESMEMSDFARAIWVSVGIGIVVQVLALLITRSFGPGNLIAGWGIGALLRLVVLVAYAWGIVPALGLPLAPALVSLAAVLFLTTLLEPLLLSKKQ